MMYGKMLILQARYKLSADRWNSDTNVAEWQQPLADENWRWRAGAYCKHHSTETALVYIHDHLISAMGSQKVSCLCLLDLSAAFNTIDHDILITRLSSWFGIHGSGICSQLVQIISVISLLSCKMWNRLVLLAHFLLRCPPRLCPWYTTLRHVHHSSQYPHFILFPKPSPLCRWHSALSFLPSDSLRLQHRSPSRCSRPNFILDDCKSSNSELLQDWISAHWSQ